MSSDSPVLGTLPTLDNLFESVPSNRITRSQSDQVVNVIQLNSETEEIPDFITDDEVLQCNFIGVMPFKLPIDDSKCSASIGPKSLDDASAMALAVEHLNTGDSSIVSSLGSIREQCSNLFFTIEYLDTRDDPGVAIEEVFGTVFRDPLEYGYRTPCSFVGATRSAVTMPMALLTGHKGYLEVSASSTSSELDDRVQYPRFGRTIPSEHDNVKPIVSYFADVLGLKYLAVVHVNEPYGNSFSEALAREADKRSSAPHIRRISIDSTGYTLRLALKELRNSQYSYVIAAMPNMRSYDELMEEAFKIGVAGNEYYQWYFADSFVFLKANHTNNSLRLAYNRTGMFRPSAGRINNQTNFDEFASQLRELTSDDMDYIKHAISSCPRSSDQPLNDNNEPNTDRYIPDTSAFVYDATIAAGISACYGAKAARLNNTLGFDGTTQFDALRESTHFNGSTGFVEFSNSTGSRTYTSVFYDLNNYITEELLDEETSENLTVFRETVTDLYHRGEWSDGKGDFVFSNGMGILQRPSQLQPTNTQGNLTPKYMKGIALFFSAFSMFLAIGFGIWTWRNRKSRVIMASQPFFLYLVLFGVALVAASIIPYSIDDRVFSKSTVNMACTAVVWLLFSGLAVIFSALFTKTYRINLIMSNSKKFRRVKVTIRQTLSTMGVMLFLTFLTLSIMTSLHPPKYERMVLFEDDFDRPTSTYGQCVWEEPMPYIICLFIINILIASLSAWQSWKARALSTEFAESKYIFATLLITMTLLFVGLPVTMMSRENPKTAVFTYSAAVFIFCMAIYGLIFIPKLRFQIKQEGTKGKPTTFIGGLHPEGSPTIPTGGTLVDAQDAAGDVILTTTSPRILARQVTELQKLLQEKERELDEYKSKCTDENA